MDRLSLTVCLASCLCAGMGMAADIAYTGGGAKGVLTDAANWGGTLPGEDDVALIDLSQTGSSVVLDADWSVKGLSFVNGSNTSGVWLGRKGTPRLTLGESGLTVDKAYSFYVQLDVTLTAGQTWSMGNARLYFTRPATLAGSADWTISDFAEVRNEIALNYGGKISYSKTYNPVWNTVAGRWAETVAFSGTGGQNERPVVSISSGETSVSDMFGDRKMNFQSGPAMLNFGNYGHAGAFATFKIEEGDAVNLGYAYTTLAGGDLQLAGGTFTSGTYFDLGIDNGIFGTKVSRTNATRFLVSDGLLDPVYLGVGRRHAAYGDGGSAKRIVQTGGTVGLASRAHALIVGGGTSTTANAGPEPLAEYRLEGGALNFPNANKSEHGLALSCNNEASGGTIPGVFTQTGGTATFGEVQFGSRQNGHWGTPENAKPNIDGFGLLDLAGGTFNLGANGFTLAPKWNVGGSESNAAYRVRLRGGTLVPGATQSNGMALDVTGVETSTIEVAAGRAFVQDAPVRGLGRLRKTGTGTLVLRDATRFTGDILVEEGRVQVEGAAPTLDGALVWTADDATDGLEDGASVSSWADTTGTYVAGANDFANYTLLPTATNNAFNGHAGISFHYDTATGNSASMKFPGGQNALCGLTNFTVVVVARPARNETSEDAQGLTGSTWLWCDSILGNAVNNTSAFFTLQYTKDGADAGCYFGSAGELPRCPVSSDMRKGVTSVIVASRRGNAFEINVNGVQSNRVYTAFSGDQPCWNGDETKPLYLACNGLGANRGFKGDLAEIRIYRDRILTASEKESLVLELLDKYEASAERVATLCHSRTLPTADEFGEAATPVSPTVDATLSAEDLMALESADGCGRPELVAGAMGGKPVVRFDGASALSIPAADSPISGATAFTVAVVFRAQEEGIDENVYAGGLGLVSSKQVADNAPDFVLSWRNEGAIGAGYGATDGNEPLFSFKPCRLADGEGHVAVFAVDPTEGVMRIMTDGCLVKRPLSANETRGDYPVCIGALTPDAGFFKGDVAAIKLAARALSEDEMRTLSEAWAAEYRLGLLGRFAFGPADLTAHGLAARSVSVAAGATLVVPDSSQGLVIANGTAFSCKGTVIGRLTLADGAVIDVDWNSLPASLGKVSASGVVTIRVNNAPSKLDAHGRINLLHIEELDVTGELTWRIEGLDAVNTPVLDERRGMVYTRLPGFVMTVR